MNFKAFTAIAVCKLLRLLSRLLHRGGTAMPGRIALKICPELLGILSKDVKTVAVTGTNGKTTSARMIEEAFALTDKSYFSNKSGANLISGITTEFVMNCSLSGKMRKQYAVIECDEAAARKVFGELQPQVIVVTNLFRDQLDRFGEVTHTLENIKEGILQAPNALCCLNADCSLTSSLALDVPNRIVYFGINKSAAGNNRPSDISDATHCIRCKSEYEYSYISYGHLGGFRCPKCGYSRHDAQYEAVDILEREADHSTVIMDIKGSRSLVRINLPAMYNIYNAAGAMAAVCEMGIDSETAVKALGLFKCGFGRMEQFSLGNAGAKMMLVKNPAGCDQVIDFLGNLKEKFCLVICLNDRSGDGTDISWIWDADFEALSQMGGRLQKVVVSGDRAADMKVRIKYAGIPEENVLVEKDYEKLVDFMEQQNDAVFIMPTYTAMLDLRTHIIDRCGGAEFWE